MNRYETTAPLLVVCIWLSACTLPASSTAVPPAPSDAPAVSPTQPVPEGDGPQAEHRIAIRQADGAGEFYDRETGATFTPRGANYVFVPLGDSSTNLLLKTDIYDPARTRADFASLAALGYNTVRVFLDQCNRGEGCIGDADNQGLNPAYLDNIADMMAAGRETGIFILFTSNDLPDQGGYAEQANLGSGGQFAGYRNSYYLRSEAVAATRRYWRDLLIGLSERGAAFDAVLGWQLLNEQWMFRDQPPLSLTGGVVETTTDSYDMADPAQKKQMVSDGLVYYIRQMKEEILLHDPTALVTMGFFVPELVAPDWYVETASLLERSALDFFDFHAYPGPLTLEAHADGFGMRGYAAKPIVLGEYGAFRHVYSELDNAARAVSSWTAASCELGFDGWLYWTYYPAPASMGDRTWGLVDEDDYLLELFAPVNQPDPCAPVEIANDNLAYGKPVLASRSLPEEPPAQAVDDNPATQWGAGESPVQWIEVDLQGSYRITEIRLLVAQWPESATVHWVQIRTSASDAYQTVHEFNGSTRDNDWLSFTPAAPLENATHVRIQTVSSPSWVAWKEIQVYGEAVQP